MSPLVLLSVPATSFHSHRYVGSQAELVIQARAQVQWELAQNQEDQQAKMAEQVDTTFREVPSQMSQADSVRLLPWFLSTTANPSTGAICSVSEALTTVMQPKADAPTYDTTLEFEGITALASTSSPAHQASTLPPVLPMLDIPATGIPVGHLFLALAIGLKHKKWD